jgi:protein-S-isoprenylcysteine O-methyltransferase Ste14
MTIYRWLIVALWLIFAVYWGISAIGAKRNVGHGVWRKQLGLRLSTVVVTVLIVLAYRIPSVHALLQFEQAQAAASTLRGVLGDALCALGVGVAIWARVYLGRNWGMPMSRKENPELVTGGPYACVRHPIYTGILLAMLGSAIAVSVVWLLPLILFGAYFIYSARQEERLMIEQFPEAYAAYMKRTKRLLPFVL